MKQPVYTYILALITIVLAFLFYQQGKTLDDAIEQVKVEQQAPEAMTVLVTNNVTGQQVSLACTTGADVVGVSDYSMSIYAKGKANASYGCSHIKTDILTPPSPPAPVTAPAQ